jgi:ABC-2 type transport system ATP-binding protein
MSQAAIKTKKLSKRYDHAPSYALKDLSIEVQPGEVYGFLGPNGAGKSTTIRTLLNFIQPTSGTAQVLDLDIVRDSVELRGNVGYLSGEFKLYEGLTGQQFLDYMGQLQPPKNQNQRQKLVERFEAELNKPVGDLSKGNRQKLGLIQAFMHEPAVLILDEPTSGLDPLMQEAFFQLVHESKENGAALFISSHNFSEVLRMCDRVGFIRSGELVGEERISDLQDKAAHSFVITFAKTAPVSELEQIKQATIVSHDDHTVRLRLEGDLTPLFRVLASHKVQRLDQETANLEEEFLRFYEGDKK